MIGQSTIKRTNPQLERNLKVSRALADDQAEQKKKKQAEQQRKEQLALAWKPLFDLWIKNGVRKRTPNDAVALRITTATGIQCKPEDVLRRKKFLRSIQQKNTCINLW